ncbi:hypothetical protein [Cribrihabitans neustonicus]|uniref:hypothetical protein n=1 Tax=Cribrihabitans neustonicus TaxID=1429085 RepID=UPI003B5B5DF9
MRIYGTAPNTYALSDTGYRAELEEATALAAKIGQPFWVTAGQIWMAHEAVRSKGAAAALPEMEAALQTMHAIGLKLGGAYHEAMLAYCYACAGRPGPARSSIGTALAALEAGRDLIYAPEVHRLAAEISLSDGGAGPEEAEAALAHAAQLAARAGTRAWAALIAASQARLSSHSTGQQKAECWLHGELDALALPGSELHPAFKTARLAFAHPI